VDPSIRPWLLQREITARWRRRLHPAHKQVVGFGLKPLLAAHPGSLAYARGLASGTGTLLFSSGGAGGRPVTSRISFSSIYQLTRDAGVRDMFSFLLARDTMHQNQWLAAIEDLKSEGLEDTPVPSNFPQEQEMSEVAYRFMNFSEGEESREGRWAQGSSMDGKGQFEYVAEPEAMGPQMEELDPPVEPRLYSTPKQPMQPSTS
jgi:Mn-containing catalase